MKKGLRFGVQIIQGESYDAFTGAVCRAEDLGFSSALLVDHIHPGLQAPFTGLATAATVTKNIRLGFHMLNNDLRHPVLLAHEAATLDVMSNGRLELGIGAGWNEPEYEEMGISYDATGIRVERLAESISIIKGLLSGETVRFRGKYYHVNHSVKPSPIQKPRPPIAMGGSGERLLSLAAREADIISFLGWRINRTGRSLRFKIFSPEVWRG